MKKGENNGLFKEIVGKWLESVAQLAHEHPSWVICLSDAIQIFSR